MRAPRLGFLLLLLAAALPAHADTTLYTENWTSLTSNWTVAAGTPSVFSGRLRNAQSNPGESRLMYAGSLPAQDYSVQSVLNCGSVSPQYAPIFVHYLRASGYNLYKVEAYWYNAPEETTLTLYVFRNGDLLGQVTADCGTMKSAIMGSTLTVSMNGTIVISVIDSTFPSGGVGVGTGGTPDNYGTGMGQTIIALQDTQPPTVPASLSGTPYATHVNLSWTASTDNVAVTGYKVYRNGAYQGSSSTTSYTDIGVDPNTTYTYTVSAYDGGNNESGQSTPPLAVQTPDPTYAPPDAGGPVEYASTWGAGPEKIALLTGALSLRVPLFKMEHRTRGPGASLMAAWNSKFWSSDANGTRMAALDTGYGLGWNFQVGAVYPVFDNSNQVHRFEFQDAAGVIHKLWTTGTANQYKSQDSTYLLWDYAARTLTFTDGTVWTFNCESWYPEADAGTRYPTQLKDSNGNLITITYAPASGLTQTNTSARLQTITDSVSTTTWGYITINGQPHVGYVQRLGAVTNVAQFTYVTNPGLVSPFCTSPPPCQPITSTRVLLTQIQITGAPGPFVFDYNSSAELTKITFPHKGYFRYDYVTASFSTGGPQSREISARHMSADTTTEQNYTFTHPNDDPTVAQHKQTQLLDAAGNKKIWYFINGSANVWDNGLENKFETYQGAAGPTYTLKRSVDTAWTQDGGDGAGTLANPRARSVTTTQTEASVSVQSKREQDVDANGNVTEVREYGYGATPTLYRTTSTTYLTGTSYTSRNILNRPAQVTVCGPAGCGTPASTTTISYDSTSISSVSGITQHDSGYGPSFSYRGNPTTVNANGLSATQNYDEGGNLKSATDGLNHTVASTNYLQTGQVQSASSGGNTTSLTYNTDTTTHTITGSNSDTVSFTYASYRPTFVNKPDGTYTQYSYQDTANPVTQTETSYLGRVTVTTFDGFGRVIKTAVKETTSPETWNLTQTQYDACSCSSTGKAVKTSRPYRTNASGNLLTGEAINWTQTNSDALGRPVAVILPDLNQTTYTYSVQNDANWIGTVTLITDPAGKQKRYLNNAFGQLLRVDEPNASGTLVTTARYTYDVMGRMTQVQMPKANGSYTQTRTFVYNTKGQLTSATNPENGTVSYTYLADGMVQSKTDAKNQTLWFVYDTNHRLLRIESPQGTAKETFTYDTDSTIATSYATGKMTTASNDGYTWHYSYDLMGRVNKQTLETPFPLTACSNAAGFLQAQYGYDSEGRLKDFYYPGSMGCAATVQPGDHYQYSYNLLGQPLSLAFWDGASWSNQAQGATYNAAGQITSWQEGATLTRTYDSQRGWLTDLTAGYSLNFHYNYPANGRVSSVTDAVNPGQSATYTYDNLNRLSTATATNWNMAWTYDDFGNRTGQTGTGATGQPTPPTMNLAYDQTTNRITTLVYDANGNTTWQAGMNLYYDVFDRLVGTYQNQYQQTSAKYDAFGRRIERTLANGTTKVYFTDPTGRLLAEYSGWSYNSDNYTGQGVGISSSIKYFAGQRIGQWTDRTGNVRYANGGWKHYYPYGEEITSTTNDTYKFAELYRDADTGLDYAMNRYSSSAIGRFLTRDPYSGSAQSDSPQSWNRYTYVQGDPVNFSDPTGLYTNNPPPDPEPEPNIDFALPSRPVISPVVTPFGRAVDRLTAAQNALADRHTFSADCEKDIAALSDEFARSDGSAFDAFDLAQKAAGLDIQNGATSTLPVSTLYAGPAAQAGRAYQAQEDAQYGPGQTIANDFARNPNGLTAASVLFGNTVFINPNLIGSISNNNQALLFHEALHATGMVDDQIQRALGIAVDPKNTKNISDKLHKDCFTGGGNH